MDRKIGNIVKRWHWALTNVLTIEMGHKHMMQGITLALMSGVEMNMGCNVFCDRHVVFLWTPMYNPLVSNHTSYGIMFV